LKSLGKSKVKCWNYAKNDHTKKDCKEKKKEKNESDHDSNSQASQDESKAFVVALAMHACDDACMIDFDVSFHMTPHRE